MPPHAQTTARTQSHAGATHPAAMRWRRRKRLEAGGGGGWRGRRGWSSAGWTGWRRVAVLRIALPAPESARAVPGPGIARPRAETGGHDGAQKAVGRRGAICRGSSDAACLAAKRRAGVGGQAGGVGAPSRSAQLLLPCRPPPLHGQSLRSPCVRAFIHTQIHSLLRWPPCCDSPPYT